MTLMELALAWAGVGVVVVLWDWRDARRRRD